MEIGAFTINSFSGIPLCTKFFEGVFADFNVNKKIVIHHCDVKGFVGYSEKIIIQPLRVFNSFESFKSQSSIFKILKYLKIFKRVLTFMLAKKKPVVYTIDANTCAICLVIKKMIFYKRIKVIYHQFEMDIPEEKAKIDKLIFGLFKSISINLDLFLVPEKNRLFYFREIVKVKADNCIIFPNTTSVNIKPKEQTDKIIFGHVGALGPTHYIEPFIKAFAKLDIKTEFLVIGRVADETRRMFSKYALKNIKLINQVQHDELDKYYALIDIGLILYMPVDLNNRYCAPNKLYEFWSYGIPVVAPDLEGLHDIFTKPFLGKLIDMENEQIFSNELGATVNDFSIYDRNVMLNYFDEYLSIRTHLEKLKIKMQEFN